MIAALIAASAIASLPVSAADMRWRIQYFYDVHEETFVISDIKFSSPSRGIAVGTVLGKHKPRPMSVITLDGGAHWTQVPLQEAPISLFLLNDSAWWMVTERGIWFTNEGGRDWKKLHKTNVVGQVWFRDAEHGYAIGIKKTVLQSADGGATWQPLEIASKPQTNPDYTAYLCVDFWTPTSGLIVGRSKTPRSSDAVPLWMDPHPEWRKEYPSTTIFLQTMDGGANWKQSQTSLFGTVSRVVMNTDGKGLALLDYERYFTYPSEVFKLDNHNAANQFHTAYRSKSQHITDIAVTPEGVGYAAGVEKVGEIASTPIPTKVKVLESHDLAQWVEMPVDYRATATNVILAQSGSDAWIATDAGMILKFMPSPPPAKATARVSGGRSWSDAVVSEHFGASSFYPHEIHRHAAVSH